MIKTCILNKNTSIIALGANLKSALGGPAKALAYAIERLSADGYNLKAISRLYSSPAFPAGSGPDYVNGCVIVEYVGTASPESVLENLHAIEAEMGRVRHGRWQARVIDLDLIAMGDAVRPTVAVQNEWRHLTLDRQMRDAPDQLILPHPRLQDRAFVLIPLAEIAPFWRHPVTRKTVIEMCDALPEAEKAALVPVSTPFDED